MDDGTGAVPVLVLMLMLVLVLVLAGWLAWVVVNFNFICGISERKKKKKQMGIRT